MTTAPNALMTARRWIIDTWGVDPGGVGIVGNPDHKGGYHCGEDRVLKPYDYSVNQSTRDLKGLSGYASALDIGNKNDAGKLWRVGDANLIHFSLWLVKQCAANTNDTRNIREVIYSPDGRTVKRWDRLKRSTTGDDSHTYHTHISIFRDASNADLLPLFKRYMNEVTGMDYTDDVVRNPRQRADSDTNETVKFGFYLDDSYQRIYDIRDDVKALTEKVDAIRPVTYVQLTDEQFERWLDKADNGE